MSATQEIDRLSKPYQTSGQKKHPCVLCQQRKVKCDRELPCSNCRKACAECISPSTLPPRPRKRRFPEAELLARIRKYEHHLRSYGADIDAINREKLPEVNESSRTKESRSTPPYLEAHRPLSVRRSLRHVENNLWAGVNEEFRDAEEILQGSSEDEMFENPITKTYDTIGGDGGDLIFGSTPRQNLNSLHPSPVHIFRLWQTYLDNVDPLTKVFHAPTVQQRLLDATADLENIPKAMEALMFSIYAMSIISLNNEECQRVFIEERSVLLARYQSATRRALNNANYLRSSDLTVLQGFTLHLLSSLHLTIDPRSLFCLCGVAVRIAQRIGLSSDGTHFGLLPCETEMRRRLWWQIVTIDSRVSELSGAGPMLLTYTWDTKIPSNVNDSDIFQDMRDPPLEREGPTEMIFVRLRYEILNFTHQSRLEHPECHSGPSRDIAIDSLEQRIEKQYLSFCDPTVALHYVSSKLARTGICKLRMGFRQIPRHIANLQQGTDKMFILALDMLENYNLVMASPFVQKFIWIFWTTFPLPALLYLVVALRRRPADEFAEKAWRLLAENDERREWKDTTQQRDSMLSLAIASLTIKAWEAREATLQEVQPTPRYISRLRQQLATKKRGSFNPTSCGVFTSENNSFNAQFTSNFGFDNQMANSAPGLDLASTSFQQMLPPDPAMDWAFWNGLFQGDENTQSSDAARSQDQQYHGN